MRSMALTLDTILQAEFCTNPPLRTFFLDHFAIQALGTPDPPLHETCQDPSGSTYFNSYTTQPMHLS